MIDDLNQAEQFFLGQLLAYPEKLAECEVTSEFFTVRTNAVIFEAIVMLEAERKLIDVITVSDALNKKDSSVIWLAKLGQYQNDSFSPTFFESSQIVIIEKYRERVIKSIALDLSSDFDADKAIKSLMSLDTERRNYLHTMPSAAMQAIAKAEEAAKNNGLVGLSTGLGRLDKTLGGLQAPDLIVIGARPATGKTSVALNFMLKHDIPVAFFSTEQPADQVGLRAISAKSGVSASKIRNANFNAHEMNAMSAGVTELTRSKIFIYDKGSIGITELTREARKLKHKHDIGIIYVDYIQRMKIEGNSRLEGLGDSIRGLKTLAKELNVPVVVLAQVNRDVEKRPDKRPKMSDLKDSGEIEQEADAVILLYRDDVYKKANDVDDGAIEFLIDKNRHGATGSMTFAWHKDTMQVTDFNQY